MILNTLIVDDEALARNRLRKFLAQEPNLNIVGECANGPEAVAFIRQRQPDLVFLDVQMPEVSGFDVIRALDADTLPAIVFVTAHDRHAVKAFEVSATDYLLKPFTQERLKESLRRVRERLQAPPAAGETSDASPEAAKRNPAYLRRFAVKEQGQVVFIKIEDVDYVESASNYAVLHTQNGNHVLRETISNLENSLPPELFVRISRAILVNLERVKAIRGGGQNDWMVILRDDRQLAMTRGFHQVQERLQYSREPGKADSH